MNQILEWLLGGDLRSDGLSAEVANFVLANHHLIDELIEGLDEPLDLIRGRTADALEKIARVNPELVVGYMPKLSASACKDPLPMVKMHIAMLLGHLAMIAESAEDITQVLLDMLDDQSVFTRSWAIVSLCIIGRIYQEQRERIVKHVVKLKDSPSVAVRTRVRHALEILTNETSEFPKGWIKSQLLQDI
jgi:HEAT repeat protein